MTTGATIAMICIVSYLSVFFELPGTSLAGTSSSAPSPFDFIFGPFSAASVPSNAQEVFYIAGNSYTYDDAPGVCAAQNAELATYEQVSEAHSKGAEWCGYGWTAGGMALFPTQESTWTKLQTEIDIQKKTKCGRPGVNGGYFDPNTKFGVNCYGVKPECDGCTHPLQADKDPEKEAAAAKFRQSAKDMKLSPFNSVEWSMWGTQSNKN